MTAAAPNFSCPEHDERLQCTEATCKVIVEAISCTHLFDLQGLCGAGPVEAVREESPLAGAAGGEREREVHVARAAQERQRRHSLRGPRPHEELHLRVAARRLYHKLHRSHAARRQPPRRGAAKPTALENPRS